MTAEEAHEPPEESMTALYFVAPRHPMPENGIPDLVGHRLPDLSISCSRDCSRDDKYDY